MIRMLKPGEAPPYALLLLADPDRSVIEAYVHRSVCFVAELENETICACLLLAAGPDTMEIINIAVREDHQGRGFGKRLIEHAVRYSAELGYRQMHIGTGNSSLQQLALYQKCGFRIVGVEPDYFIKHYAEPIYENGIPCRDRIHLRKRW
ncbi:N-acetyltransferase [Paenibacillus sp. R14(2021)]|uniref:GNAT family N-acetyltransferase n=1 Tax=Paenibacillus sp. R14(2021) TaxID=2859228 RepID=UPI001C611B84|nr:GNAT family N-acetyltransferase [Paenibacillus sp. R14(2021)]